MPTFEFSTPGGVSSSQKDDLFQNLGAKIKVVGIGGAGGNAVNNMIESKYNENKFFLEKNLLERQHILPYYL